MKFLSFCLSVTHLPTFPLFPLFLSVSSPFVYFRVTLYSEFLPVKRRGCCIMMMAVCSGPLYIGPMCPFATLWRWCSDLLLCGTRHSGPSALFLRSCWLCGSCRCLAGGGCWDCPPYQWQYLLSAAMWVYFCFYLISTFLLFTMKGSKLQFFFKCIHEYIPLIFCLCHLHKVASRKSSLQHFDGTEGEGHDDHSKHCQGEQQADASGED